MRDARAAFASQAPDSLDLPGPPGDAAAASPAAAGTVQGRSSARAAVKHLRTGVSGRTFAAKLLLCGLLTAGGVLLVLQHSLWSRIAGVVVLGCMFAHAGELQH